MKSKEKVDPDRLASLFVEITDDLSYARTHFPEGRSTEFLNSLAAKTHLEIYRRKRERLSNLKSFWTEDVPMAIRQSHGEMLFAFILTAIFFFIGWVSSSLDSGFTRLVLGEGYVEMSINNIESGDPMAVYGDSGMMGMFLFIMLNNLKVMVLFFVLGITAGLGTLAIMFRNGVMLGTFHYLFYEYNETANFLSAVYMHGTIEISMMVVSGAAGLVLARGMLFPGTYSRMVSFRQKAAQGGRVILGIFPFVIGAAAIESFLTRFYLSGGLVLNLTVIGFSAILVVWYFILLPIQVQNRIKRREAEQAEQLKHVKGEVRTA